MSQQRLAATFIDDNLLGYYDADCVSILKMTMCTQNSPVLVLRAVLFLLLYTLKCGVRLKEKKIQLCR
jgi:hypothetical protein